MVMPYLRTVIILNTKWNDLGTRVLEKENDFDKNPQSWDDQAIIGFFHLCEIKVLI